MEEIVEEIVEKIVEVPQLQIQERLVHVPKALTREIVEAGLAEAPPSD